MADDHRRLVLEIEFEIGEVGMAVVPRDEIAGAVAPWQRLAGNVQRPAQFGAGREHDGVISLAELVDRDVVSNRDAADETKTRRSRDPVEGGRDLLELWMVGSDAEPHQPVGHRQPLEHVDGHRCVGAQQRFGGVEAARSAADDSDAELARIDL